MAKRARKRPKFGLKVAEISDTFQQNARYFEKKFWQHWPFWISTIFQNKLENFSQLSKKCYIHRINLFLLHETFIQILKKPSKLVLLEFLPDSLVKMTTKSQFSGTEGEIIFKDKYFKIIIVFVFGFSVYNVRSLSEVGKAILPWTLRLAACPQTQ